MAIQKKVQSKKPAKKAAVPTKKALAKKAPAKPASKASPAKAKKTVPVKKPAAVKKAPAKKVPAKKAAPAKKPVPSKKAAPAKKAAPSKKVSAPAKKVAPKQAPAKKVVPKPVAKKAAPARKPSPAKKPVAKAVSKPAKKPVAKPVAKPAPKPAAKPAPKPVAKPAPKPVARKPLSAGTPTPKSTAKPRAYTAEELAIFRIQLVQQLELVHGNLRALSADNLKRSPVDANGDISTHSTHMADHGTDNFDRELALNLASGRQESIYDIEEAIRRIDEGTYGVCESCGGPIEHPRLKALPFAKKCVACQSASERGRTRYRPFGGTIAMQQYNSPDESAHDTAPEQE